jgi:hypothetical protein
MVTKISRSSELCLKENNNLNSFSSAYALNTISFAFKKGEEITHVSRNL